MFQRIGGLVVALSVILFATALLAADIVGWRTDGSGRYAKANPPTKWSQDEGIVWKAELPGNGFGSPVVVGDRIYVTSEPGELLCFRRSNGELLWQKSHSSEQVYGEEKGRQIEEQYAQLEQARNELRKQHGELRKKEPRPEEQLKEIQTKIEAVEQQIKDKKKIHAPPARRGGAGNAAATPVSDGQHVWAAFGNGIVSCHTLDGKQRWLRFVEGSDIGFGHSSSPVLAAGNVFVHFHDLVALDAATGEQQWRQQLPARHATSLPVVVGDTTILITPAGSAIRANDGGVLADDLGSLSECSPVLQDGVVYMQGGQTRAWRLPGRIEGDTKFELAWEANAARGRRTPSPVCHNGLIYGVTTDGILDVSDAASGEQVYRRRLDLKQVYSSATSAGPYVFLSDTRGTTIVLKGGREYEEVTRNEFESFGSCPVFVDNRLYLRTRKHLVCIGE